MGQSKQKYSNDKGNVRDRYGLCLQGREVERSTMVLSVALRKGGMERDRGHCYGVWQEGREGWESARRVF